jgi:hypothetical protein
VSDYLRESNVWGVDMDIGGYLNSIWLAADDTKILDPTSPNEFIYIGSPTNKKQCDGASGTQPWEDPNNNGITCDAGLGKPVGLKLVNETEIYEFTQTSINNPYK